jgi:hypothetical protein
MTTLPRLARDEVQALPMRAREIVGYRKSGLSLNHIQGCPLDCAYCIRYTYGLWDQRQPRALMSDDEAVDRLARLLINDGRSVHLTCVPSGGPIGALARELTETLHGIALALLIRRRSLPPLDRQGFPTHASRRGRHLRSLRSISVGDAAARRRRPRVPVAYQCQSQRTLLSGHSLCRVDRGS